MNKYILAIGALAMGFLMGPSLVSAYRGDPNVQGPNYSPERHEIVTNALENGDYKTWSRTMEGTGIVRRITESNFSKFQELHKNQLAGNTTVAARIRSELGLGVRDGSGSGYGRNR